MKRILSLGILLFLLLPFSSIAVDNDEETSLQLHPDLNRMPVWMNDRVLNETTYDILTNNPNITPERYTVFGIDWDRRRNVTTLIIENDGDVVGAFPQVFREHEMINATTIAVTDYERYVAFWNLETNVQEIIPIPESLQDDSLHHDWEYNALTDTFMFMGRERVQNVTVDGEVRELLEDTIFEFDRAGNILFEWHAHEKLPIDLDQYYKQNITYRGDAEFIHLNGFFWEDDKDYFYLSARHAHTLFKVNKTTGDVIWHLGAWDSNFTLYDIDGNEVESLFHGQHGFKYIGNNRFLLFNNGWQNLIEPDEYRSFFMELEVDEEDMTARVVWQYAAPTDTHYSAHTGDLDNLPNGNRIGVFGGSNNQIRHVREVTPAGEVAWEIAVDSYGMDRVVVFYDRPIIELNAISWSDATLSVDLSTWNSYNNMLEVPATVTLMQNNAVQETVNFEFKRYWQPTLLNLSFTVPTISSTDSFKLVIENEEGLSSVVNLDVSEYVPTSTVSSSSEDSSTSENENSPLFVSIFALPILAILPRYLKRK